MAGIFVGYAMLYPTYKIILTTPSGVACKMDIKDMVLTG
jgi:hypothetical protein